MVYGTRKVEIVYLHAKLYQTVSEVWIDISLSLDQLSGSDREDSKDEETRAVRPTADRAGGDAEAHVPPQQKDDQGTVGMADGSEVPEKGRG